MRLIHTIPVALGAALLLNSPGFAASRSEEAHEKSVALSSVPKAAVDAAKKALGADPTEAKIVSGTNPQQYELSTKGASGKEESVHVRGNGTVVKRESESEENEQGEHDED